MLFYFVLLQVGNKVGFVVSIAQNRVAAFFVLWVDVNLKCVFDALPVLPVVKDEGSPTVAEELFPNKNASHWRIKNKG